MPPPNQAAVNEHFTAFTTPSILRTKPNLLLALMTLLTFLVDTPDLEAQVDSPCSCSGFTVVGAANTETNYSSLSNGLQPNQCYLVAGTLVMDVGNASLNSVRLIMARKSAIRVDEDPIILNSYISGCGNMWKGIHTNDSVSIAIFYSVIEDAEIGLLLGLGTGLACQFNDFINDYIGIATANPFDGDIFDNQIEQKEPILGCRFFTSGTLPDPYPGQYYYPSWPDNPTIPYDQGFTAIYINGTAGLNVGKKGATGAVRNKIFNMRNGIILRHSIADIFGTDFYDFEGGIPRALPDPLLDLNQNGIHATGAFIRVEDNTMDNLKFGINTEQSWSYINDNTLDIEPGVRSSRGIFALLPQALEIVNNVIYNGHRGIYLRNVNNSFDIRDNVLIRDSVPLVNVGISIESQQFTGNQTGRIRSNSIEITDGNGAIGIHLLYSHRCQVTENSIGYLIDQGQDLQSQGIVSAGSVGLMIAGNTIEADEDYINLTNRGIASDMSSFNALVCNTIANFQSSVYFMGPHFQTKLDRNEMMDADFGLYLEPPVFLGIQEHLGNQWSGTYGEFGAYIDDEFVNPQMSAEMSLFLVDPNDNSDFMPSSVGPPAVENIWFNPQQGDVPTACLSIPDNPVLDADTLEKILLTEFEFEAYEEEINWILKSDLFELVHLFHDLKSNAVLDSFYDTESANALGKLVLWQDALATTFDLQEEDKAANEDSLLTFAIDVTYIDSLLGHRPSDSLIWLDLRVLKVDTLSRIFERWLGLLDDEQTATASEYEDIADNLDNLTVNLSIEENFQQSLILLVQQKLGIGFSGSDSTAVASMMEYCPLEAGRTLVTARELQSIFYDTIVVPDISNCSSGSPFVVFPSMSKYDDAGDIVVTPNPFTNNLDITFLENVQSLSIYNSIGQLIYKSLPHQPFGIINTNGWPAGLYHLITKKGSRIKHAHIVRHE